MNRIVRERGDYTVARGIERATKRLAFQEEGLFVDVAERIIDAMESRGINRSELARRLKVSPAYITKVLRGHANLSLESLAKLAFALDLKWECILIPIGARIGVFSLTDESGAATIRTVETATVEAAGRLPIQEEYVHDTHTTESHCELRIPA